SAFRAALPGLQKSEDEPPSPSLRVRTGPGTPDRARTVGARDSFRRRRSQLQGDAAHPGLGTAAIEAHRSPPTFAERVHIYVKGRVLPHFYLVKMPGLKFLLGVTSTKESGWTTTGQGFGQMRAGAPPAPALLDRAASELAAAFHLPAKELAARLET